MTSRRQDAKTQPCEFRVESLKISKALLSGGPLGGLATGKAFHVGRGGRCRGREDQPYRGNSNSRRVHCECESNSAVFGDTGTPATKGV